SHCQAFILHLAINWVGTPCQVRPQEPCRRCERWGGREASGRSRCAEWRNRRERHSLVRGACLAKPALAILATRVRTVRPATRDERSSADTRVSVLGSPQSV